MDRERAGELLRENYGALERYVKFRVDDSYLAEDIIQETALSALDHADSLRREESFRVWLYRIARNKLYDHFKRNGRELSFGSMDVCSVSRVHSDRRDAVFETLEKLNDDERKILLMCYINGYTQKEAAQKLGIPLGTLKTRLSAAKKRFRKIYPYNYSNEEEQMKDIKFPEYMPEYSIKRREEEPFPVLYEGIIGWGVIPRLGEKCSWAAYDFPEKKITDLMEMEVTGKCEVHGIEGVEIKTHETSRGGTDPNVFTDDEIERIFAAQLTDTHCRILAESHLENGVRRYFTFLDGDSFLGNWGYGEDNCGTQTHLVPRGYLVKSDGAVKNLSGKRDVMDLSGRFDVTILGKTYDTVCLTDIETYDEGVMTETYLDRDGREILWRRFNKNNWRHSALGTLWSDRFPRNERISVDGELYVHWYDCLFGHMLR